MPYPQEFINSVIAEYPDYKELHQHLHAGSYFVGRYLQDCSDFSLTPGEIIFLFKENRQQEVLEAARRAERRQQLYEKWMEIVDGKKA